MPGNTQRDLKLPGGQAASVTLPNRRPLDSGNDRLVTGVANAFGNNDAGTVTGAEFGNDLLFGPNGIDATDTLPPLVGTAAGAAAYYPHPASKADALAELATGKIDKLPSAPRDAAQTEISEKYRRLQELGRTPRQIVKDMTRHGTGAASHVEQQLHPVAPPPVAARPPSSPPAEPPLPMLQRMFGVSPPGGEPAPAMPGSPATLPSTVSRPPASTPAPAPGSGPGISGPDIARKVEYARSALPRASLPRRIVRGGTAAIASDLLTRVLLNLIQGPPAPTE